jgi:hypothetical protein
MSFLRHGEIYRPDVVRLEPRGRTAASRWSAPGPGKGSRREERALAHHRVVSDNPVTSAMLFAIMVILADSNFSMRP